MRPREYIFVGWRPGSNVAAWGACAAERARRIGVLTAIRSPIPKPWSALRHFEGRFVSWGGWSLCPVVEILRGRLRKTIRTMPIVLVEVSDLNGGEFIESQARPAAAFVVEPQCNDSVMN